MKTLFFSCSDQGRRATDLSTNHQHAPGGGGDGAGGGKQSLAFLS